MRLIIDALTKFISGFLIVAVLIFLPAGTLDYAGGIAFICLLFIPIFILGIIMLVKAPELLKERLDGKEKQTEQKWVVALSGLVFLVGFVLAGLDFRFKWINLPNFVSVAAGVVFVLSYLLYAEVMRENAYLSRTIKVQQNQRVIDTGLYSVVRHPMYAATILMFLMIPLILGSLVSFCAFLCYPILIAVRIKDEEKILTAELTGYREYKQKVQYRIIPFIW